MRRISLLSLALMVHGVCGCSGSTPSGESPDAAYTVDAAVPSDALLPALDLFVPPDAAHAARSFPDTTSSIAVLIDQLPGGMTAAQQQFVASHFVGSQKLTLDISRPLRALNPKFLVLHYHLAIWQSAPEAPFILDGNSWSNDFPSVTTHESWFWHNQMNQRVASTVDKKVLMNIGDMAFADYWASSIVAQVRAGDYDGVFADSASPALLQAEVGGQDARLAGTGARDTPIAELGNQPYVAAWQIFIARLDAALAAAGVPLIPNTSAFVTTWDQTRYDLTAGVFVEGFASPGFATADWIASTNQLLSLAAKDKIIILQNYLASPNDLATRRYYFGNYLLVKGKRTYLDYFAQGPLEWYPEWGIDLGAPTSTGAVVTDLWKAGVYQRGFEKGIVLVNPSAAPVDVPLGAALNRLEPMGGGRVIGDGATPGSIHTTSMSMITVPARGAEILLR